jgi:AraC-like DNA-binding protein
MRMARRHENRGSDPAVGTIRAAAQSLLAASAEAHMKTENGESRAAGATESLRVLALDLRSTDIAVWPRKILHYLHEVEAATNGDPSQFAASIFELSDLIRELLAGGGPPGDTLGRLITDPHRADDHSPSTTGLRRCCRQSPCVRQAAEIIEQRYPEPLTTGAIALEVGRDRSYLAMLFHRETGQTLHRYMTEVRLAHAAHRILQGEKIDAIVLAVGYQCKKNFYRQFRAKTGLTPLAFRRLCLAHDHE